MIVSNPHELLPRSFFLAERLPPMSPLKRLLRLFTEGLFFTACALLLARATGIPQSGFFAVFLAAAGPTSRVEEFLSDNRRKIEIEKVRPIRANLSTALSVLGLFLGSFAAFFAAALWLGERGMVAEFGFVLDAAGIGSDTILTRRFAGSLPLFINNALVLLTFFGLAFIYRSYGALLALSWNACLWGLVLAFLVRRGIAGSTVHPALFVPASTLAVLPHLLLEAAAYVMATLAAIFFSKGVVKYSPAEPVFRAVMRSVGLLLLGALAILFLGALVESTVPRALLRLLAR